MDWPPFLLSLAGPAIAVPTAVAVSKFLSDRSIERLKAQQSRELLETQNTFSASATSHMAIVAFDKHIGFCEEYVEEVYKALHALIPDGRTEEALDPRRFSQIRQKWALWLTHEIENKLDRFELAITLIIGGPAQVFEAYGSLASNESSIKQVIVDLREVLRTEELTALRNELVIRSSRKPGHVV